jgi:hypothetical protein
MIPIILAFAFLVGAAPGDSKEKSPTIYQIPLPERPDFSAVDWLIGEWAGKTTDQRTQGDLRLSVSYQLDKHVVVLRGDTTLQPTKTSPPTRESWLGVLTADRRAGGFLLREFSSTGFVTRYRLTVDGPEIHMNPEGGDQPPPGWLFRTVIRRTNPQEFVETIQVAPPNKSFFDYYTAKLSRLAPEDKTKTAPAPPH